MIPPHFALAHSQVLPPHNPTTRHDTMANPPRSTRNRNPPSFPEGLDALTGFTDKTLTPKSKLDDFREFFDFKVGSWKRFHTHFKEHVLLSSTWAEMQESATKREAVAATFLEQVGSGYWGKENKEKYLIEDHVKNGDVCVYPRDKKTWVILSLPPVEARVFELTLTRLIKALAFLLEKDSKNHRESVSQDVSFPYLEDLVSLPGHLLAGLLDAEHH